MTRHHIPGLIVLICGFLALVWAVLSRVVVEVDPVDGRAG